MNPVSLRHCEVDLHSNPEEASSERIEALPAEDSLSITLSPEYLYGVETAETLSIVTEEPIIAGDSAVQQALDNSEVLLHRTLYLTF